MRHVLQTRGTYLPKTSVAEKHAACIADSRYLLTQNQCGKKIDISTQPKNQHDYQFYYTKLIHTIDPKHSHSWKL